MHPEKHLTIYAVHYNRPEFVQWQHACLKAHLRDESWDFVVINNAREVELRNAISHVAASLELRVIHTHSATPFHLCGKHHADALNTVWRDEMARQTDKLVAFMDGDCFLVAPFSVNAFLGAETPLGGSPQQREGIYHWLSPVIVMANPALLPDALTIDWEGIGVWEGSRDVRLDTGGGLQPYLEAHPDVKAKVRLMHNTWHLTDENRNLHCIPDSMRATYDQAFCVEFYGNEFLHYCRSSNWNHQPQSHHQAKSDWVSAFIRGAINGSVQPEAHNFQSDSSYFGWGNK